MQKIVITRRPAGRRGTCFGVTKHVDAASKRADPSSGWTTPTSTKPVLIGGPGQPSSWWWPSGSPCVQVFLQASGWQ